jgi:hypothetical protein
MPLNLKVAGSGKTAAQLGWTTVQIAGHEVALHTSPRGKGSSCGIDEAVWQTDGTVAPSPRMTTQTLDEVVTNLTTA